MSRENIEGYQNDRRLQKAEMDRAASKAWQAVLDEAERSLRGEQVMADESLRGFQFDVALSFASEDRDVVERFASALRERGVRIFYDNWYKADLWGKDLFQYLDELYREKAQFCIVFVSEAYARKLWTSHELKSAQERAFEENEEYILPVRLDDTRLPGVRDTVGYIDLRSTTPEQLAELTAAKLGKGDPPKPPAASTFRLPKLPQADRDSTADALSLLRHIERTMDVRFNSLKDAGIAVEKQGGETVVYRAKLAGRLLFYLSMQLTDDFGRTAVAFLHGWNEPSNPKGMTAFAIVESTLDQPNLIARVTDLSLLDKAGVNATLTFDQLADGIWDKACSVIESLAGRSG